MNQPTITLYQGDCLKYMKSMPDKSVDLVLTDPPYGIGEMVSGTISKMRLHKTQYNCFVDNEEYIKTVCVPAIQECIRITKAVIVTPGSKWLHYYPHWDSFGCFYMPSSKGMQMWGGMDSQPIIYYGKPYDIGKRIHKCSYILAEPPSCDLHPCSKPQNAWTKIVEERSDTNQTIFDPFMGSGTTGVACKLLRRNFIGCEIDKKYFELAKRRIDSTEWGMFE